jgi:hypothetical protein
LKDAPTKHLSVQQLRNLLHRPDVIGDPRRHRGGTRVGVAKLRVRPCVVVVEEVQRDGPSSTAAGFFPVSSGASSTSPVAMSTISFAS